MRQYLVILGFVCFAVGGIEGRALTKRQVDSSLDPNLQELDSDDNLREKRHQDLGFGVKNALLGFVFGKINSFIDQKTHWVNQLDQQNIIKNKQHNIVAPGDPVLSLSSAISGIIGEKLQAASPLIGVVIQKGAQGQQPIKRVLVVSTTTKRPTTTEDIVIFEKDKPVSLELPSRLFGSSFTLVTNLSTTVGDFMINSALRAQRLLESMRPFLWKVFGKKGLVIEAITDKPLFSDGSATTTK